MARDIRVLLIVCCCLFASNMKASKLGGCPRMLHLLHEAPELTEEQFTAMEALEYFEELIGDTSSFPERVERMYEVIRDPKICGEWAAKFKCKIPKCTKEDAKACYRTISGVCNNLKMPLWGKAFQPQARLLRPIYDDAVSAPRTLTYNRQGKLPSAREVSLNVFRDMKRNREDRVLTHLHMSWGQTLDHDLDLTPTTTDANGDGFDCCALGSENLPQCFSIDVPCGDPYFSTVNQTCIAMTRSMPAYSRCFPERRQQWNAITSYMDGSFIYGSDAELAKNLRVDGSDPFKKGELRTILIGGKEFLPEAPESRCRLTEQNKEDGIYCLLAGDRRANVVPNLSSNHIMMLREHNRIARILAELNPHWNDEKVYQETKRIVGALVQVVTYNEYLPIVLADEIMNKYKLATKEHEYKPNVDASTTNVFSTAAFRFGHSQARNTYTYSTYDDSSIVDMSDTFHRPVFVEGEDGGLLNEVTAGMMTDASMETDRIFSESVVDKLFILDNVSLDLPGINVQRGRDHGLPFYLQWREYCGLSHKFEKFEDLEDISEENIQRLKKTYASVNDIDLFAGAMSETPIPVSEVGPTFGCLMGEQFHKYRYGDRFYYRVKGRPSSFTDEQICELEKMTISKLVCRHFDIYKIQKKGFFLPDRHLNPLMDCDKLDDINLSLWKDDKNSSH